MGTLNLEMQSMKYKYGKQVNFLAHRNQSSYYACLHS